MKKQDKNDKKEVYINVKTELNLQSKTTLFPLMIQYYHKEVQRIRFIHKQEKSQIILAIIDLEIDSLRKGLHHNWILTV